MRKYNPNLRERARNLRANMTDAERLLWSRLRRKRIAGIQFYRQRPVGNYIVDFYAPKVNLVIEVDGKQHREPDHAEYDAVRDAYLVGEGLRVLRFDDRQVLKETDGVLEVVWQTIRDSIAERGSKSP